MTYDPRKPMTEFEASVLFGLCILFALFVMACLGGCKTAQADHDNIAPEFAGIYPQAKAMAIENHKRVWGAEPIVPPIWLECVDSLPNGAGGVTTGYHCRVLRACLGDPNLARIIGHEIGHALKFASGVDKMNSNEWGLL